MQAWNINQMQIINKNCYHLLGPPGVKHIKKRIDRVLIDGGARFIIRGDIKSFYASIPHHKLIKDIQQYYDDPKVQKMLKNIITNLIDTPRGFINIICSRHCFWLVYEN